MPSTSITRPPSKLLVTKIRRWWRGAESWVGSTPEICEAAAVLHDLGHPPFGHAGEVALAAAVDKAAKRWKVKEAVGSFEGNAQSFRMATRSVSHKTGEGLQLTRACSTPRSSIRGERGDSNVPDSKKKWGIYPPELPAFAWLRDERVPDHLRREKTVEAQIMDWADDVAYSIHDIDDWFRAGFMPLADLALGGPALDRLKAAIVKRRGLTDGHRIDELQQDIGGLFTDSEAFAAFRKSAPANAEGSVADPKSKAAAQAIRVVRSHMFDLFTTSVAIGVLRRRALRLASALRARVANRRPCRRAEQDPARPALDLRGRQPSHGDPPGRAGRSGHAFDGDTRARGAASVASGGRDLPGRRS